MCTRPDLRTFILCEKEHPVPPRLETLIKQSFQPNYVQPMLVYALVHDDHKRKHLTRLLSGDVVSASSAEQVTFRKTLLNKNRQEFEVHEPTEPSPTATSTTSSVNGIPRLNLSGIRESPDFVISSGNSTINMNSAFTTRSPRKKAFINSFRSAIREEGIFGNLPPLTPRASGSGTLTKYICDKLFVPSVSKMIYPHADENIAFIREISNWVDTTANYYPYVAPPKDLKESPRMQAKLFSTILKEDHMFKHTYCPTQPNTPRYMADKVRSLDTTVHTTYNDSYSAEAKEGIPFYPSKPVYQERSNRPFSLYPNVEPEEVKYTQEQFLQQVRDNKQAFRVIRNLTYCKTIL